METWGTQQQYNRAIFAPWAALVCGAAPAAMALMAAAAIFAPLLLQWLPQSPFSYSPLCY